MELLDAYAEGFGHLVQGEDLLASLEGAAFLHFIVFSHFDQITHAD
jgi:hypothetical protein